MLFLESLLPYRVKKSVELNGERLLEFSVINHDLNAFFYQQLKEESQIVFESEIYVVKNIVSKSNGNKAVEKYATCVHKFFDDGINNVKDKLHDGSITFVDFMDFVFGDTIYNDYDIKDFFRAKNIENLGRDNRISMLNRGIDHFEFEFDLQKKGDNDVKLIVANQIGDVTDIQFRYGHNVEVIDVEVDTKSLSTHIKGYGAPGIETEYTSPNVEVFGKLDAPIVEDERFKTASTLLDELKKRIIDEPRITIELTVDEFEKHINKITDKPLSVGDYISLIYEPFDDLNVFVRVIKIDTFYNSKLEVVNTILKITNDTESFLGSYLNDVSKQIEDATKGFQQNINMARNERDITISDNYIEVLTLPIIVLEATNTAAHMTVVGESASQRLLDGYFTLNGEVLETSVKQVMFQGFNTISVNFIMTQMQEGFHNLKFYLKSEGNSFFIKQNECTVFTTGQGLYAQLGTKLPSAYFAEEVRFISSIKVDDEVSAETKYPTLVGNLTENVAFSEPISVSDVPSILIEGVEYDTEPPAIPTGVVATTGYNSIALEWEPNTEISLAGYNVYVDDVKYNNQVIEDNSINISALQNGETYNIKLTAITVWSVESEPFEIDVEIQEQENPRELFAKVENYPDYNLPTQEAIDEFIDDLYSDNSIFKIIILEGDYWYLFTTEGTYIDVDVDNKIITSDGEMYSCESGNNNRSRGTIVDWSSQPQNVIVAEEYEK
mgnify:CR=1 FL=1